MLKSLLRFLSLGLFIPITFMVIMYAGLGSNYTWGGYFTDKGFNGLYSSGIYKYRVLGRESVRQFYALTNADKLPGFAPDTVKKKYPQVDENLYAAYFYNNTLFLCISCCLLILIFTRNQDPSFSLCELPIVAMTLLMAVTQYIVVPYDSLTYAFLFAAIYLITANKQSRLNSVLLLVITCLATLTRETSFIILCFYAAWFHKPLWKNPLTEINIQHKTFALLLCVFASSYLSLRLYYGFSQGMFHSLAIARNINISSIFALLFVASFIAIFFTSSVNTKALKLFLCFCIPYMLMIIIVAIPQEMRLWMPIILPMIILKTLSETPRLNRVNTGIS